VNAPGRFDPYAILTALEHHRVGYVLIGAFARVLQGTEELTRGVDLVPSLRAENLRRLQLALDQLDAKRDDGRSLALDPATIRDEPVISLRTPHGDLKVVWTSTAYLVSRGIAKPGARSTRTDLFFR
jgi:hypothetical protein